MSLGHLGRLEFFGSPCHFELVATFRGGCKVIADFGRSVSRWSQELLSAVRSPI
jgi:hypothetical protein